MKKKVRYIEEIYTDEYKTLWQAILINIKLNKESNGLHGKLARANINPNLNVLSKRRYLDKNYKEIRGVSDENNIK